MNPMSLEVAEESKGSRPTDPYSKISVRSVSSLENQMSTGKDATSSKNEMGRITNDRRLTEPAKRKTNEDLNVFRTPVATNEAPPSSKIPSES